MVEWWLISNVIDEHVYHLYSIQCICIMEVCLIMSDFAERLAGVARFLSTVLVGICLAVSTIIVCILLFAVVHSLVLGGV